MTRCISACEGGGERGHVGYERAVPGQGGRKKSEQIGMLCWGCMTRSCRHAVLGLHD